MSAESDFRGVRDSPWQDTPERRGRDTREGAHDDGSHAPTNNPPNHGLPTHGVGRFLWETPADTPIADLGDRYRQWQRDHGGDA